MGIFNFFKKQKENAQKEQQIKSYNKEHANKLPRPSFTPNKIDKLFDDEVFVFGSNLAGHHDGGAARIASLKFGAKYGQGNGLQGQSYAIPTMQGGVETIKPYVDEFIEFTRKRTDLFFFVTRIGCGIAGFKDEDIAPLFKAALQLDNVCLPKSFISVLERTALKESPSMLISYGQVRTMADILIGLDNKEHFKNSRDAIDAVGEFIRNQEESHMSISSQAFGILSHALESYDCFIDGSLNDNAVKMCLEQKHFNELYEEAMFKYCYAKIWKLICYFNDFRRYTNSMEILDDLRKIDLYKYFVMTDSAWGIGGYPKFFFARAIEEAWPIIAPHGSIDQYRLKEYMFVNHENSIRAIGLEETINRDFEMDYCHSDVFFPKRIGTAPVYVKKKNEYGRRFVKSCGEGKGPNQFPETLEFRYAEKLLWNDPNYNVYGENDAHGDLCPKYIVPKYDRTLPVYQICYGDGEKIYFENNEKLNEFYKNALQNLEIANQNEIDNFNKYCRV